MSEVSKTRLVIYIIYNRFPVYIIIIIKMYTQNLQTLYGNVLHKFYSNLLVSLCSSCSCGDLFIFHVIDKNLV